MNGDFHSDAVEQLVRRAVIMLAAYILGPLPPPDLKPNEFELLIHLGKGMNNHQIGKRIGKPSSTVANRIALLTKRTHMLRPRLALYGAALGLGVREQNQMLPGQEENGDEE
jgi:DNA-binding NarL/FixJ family response regulator